MLSCSLVESIGEESVAVCQSSDCTKCTTSVVTRAGSRRGVVDSEEDWRDFKGIKFNGPGTGGFAERGLRARVASHPACENWTNSG